MAPAVAQMHRARPKVPTSAKRTHWVLLGFQRSLLLGANHVARRTVHDTPLVTYTTSDGELRVARDACPHRGASLSCGVVRGQDVVCPYHARAVGLATQPGHFFDYVVQNGLVWLDYTSAIATQHTRPPAYPEHRDPGMRTFDHSALLRTNPVLLMESMLDWQRAAALLDPPARLVSVGACDGTKGHGKAEVQCGDLTMDVEFHAPFTASLRVRRGADTALLLCFAATPSQDGHTALHVRMSRPSDTPLSGWMLRLVNNLPSLFQAGAVATVDTHQWSANALTSPHDDLVALYRRAMRSLFPEVLDWYVG